MSLIVEAFKAKLREQGAARVAGDAILAVGTTLFWMAFIGAALGVGVVLTPPAMLLEQLTRGPRRCGVGCAARDEDCAGCSNHDHRSDGE